jgi:hypothetical protein
MPGDQPLLLPAEELGLLLQVVREEMFRREVGVEEGEQLCLVPGVFSILNPVTTGTQLWGRPLDLREVWILTQSTWSAGMRRLLKCAYLSELT